MQPRPNIPTTCLFTSVCCLYKVEEPIELVSPLPTIVLLQALSGILIRLALAALPLRSIVLPSRMPGPIDAVRLMISLV